VKAQQRDGKYIIMVTVERGASVPYCYAADGLVPQGVYVRVGSNTVTATRGHIRQMIRDSGTGLFVEELSEEQNLTFGYADRVFAERGVKFGEEQKHSLGLFRPDGRYTNLALLLSDQCPYTTKAAVFEGLNKAKFKDRKEFGGSLFQQIEDVHAYLHMLNRVASTFEGLYRVDHPDYPDIAIREAYANCLAHRDYYTEGSVLVSMFDDRLEFMSLGGAMPGVTHDLMLAGVSLTRNEKLANVFYQLNIIEAYGTGIPRIFGAYENHSAQPKIPVIDGGFLLRLPNMNYAANISAPSGKPAALTNEQQLISIFSDSSFSKYEAADVLGISVSGAYKLLQRMTEQGLLVAHKEGSQWIYSEPLVYARQIAQSDRLFKKLVAFVGAFDGGSLKLKDLVYFAGGAPMDTIPAFTDYLIVGKNGEDANIYRDALPMIKAGGIIVLSEDELRSICSGSIPAPEREHECAPGIIVSGVTEAFRQYDDLLAYTVYESKRSAFIHRYGVLQPDGTRNKKIIV
jgi:ATP-dependent DNA helicase RecG